MARRRPSRSPIYRISTPRQLDVLGSPIRNVIVEALMELAPCSAAELADKLGRSPESLYHHLRLLKGIGVVVIVQRRKGRRQIENVYDLEARDFRLDYSNRSASFRRALMKAGRSFLRLAERQLEHAIDSGGTTFDGPLRNHAVMRDVVGLSDEALGELNRRLLKLHEWLGEVDDPQAPRRLALTVAMSRTS